MTKRILVVAAHPDDEILGVGGTISRLVSEGFTATALILGEGATSRTMSREMTSVDVVSELHRNSQRATTTVGYSEVLFESLPDNRFDSIDLLDVTKMVEKHIKYIDPMMVFTHHHGDLNLDHRITCEATAIATRPLKGCNVKEVYCFETLSSTEWAFPSGLSSFRPNAFVDIDSQLELKLQAMRCYESEICEFPHPRSLKAIKAAAQKWGSVSGANAAEAFEILRMIR